MNCCDEYGNCNQGRDCPVRKNKSPAKYESGWNRLDNLLNAIAYGISIIGALCFAALINWAFWHYIVGLK